MCFLDFSFLCFNSKNLITTKTSTYQLISRGTSKCFLQFGCSVYKTQIDKSTDGGCHAMSFILCNRKHTVSQHANNTVLLSQIYLFSDKNHIKILPYMWHSIPECSEVWCIATSLIPNPPLHTPGSLTHQEILLHICGHSAHLESFLIHLSGSGEHV